MDETFSQRAIKIFEVEVTLTGVNYFFPSTTMDKILSLMLPTSERILSIVADHLGLLGFFMLGKRIGTGMPPGPLIGHFNRTTDLYGMSHERRLRT